MGAPVQNMQFAAAQAAEKCMTLRVQAGLLFAAAQAAEKMR